MDLYEALKAGTSADELLKTFHKDLDAANARITAEKEAEKAEAAAAAVRKEYLTNCREDLATAILDYIDALLGDEATDSITFESVIETLKDFEGNIKEIMSFSKELDTILKKAKSGNKKSPIIKMSCTTITDDDIINQFLKSLK